MRFLPSNPGRTAAEILLTVAIIAFVVYDLGGHTVKPEASNVVLSFEAKRPSSLPATNAVTSSRFDAEATTTICGTTSFTSSSVTVGSGNSLTFNLGGSTSTGTPCSSNPVAVVTNTTTGQATALVTISVDQGGNLNFDNINAQGSVDVAGAKSGPLSMAAGSSVTTSLIPGYVGNPLTNAVYPLLLAQGACPSFAGVTFPATTNCPVDTTLAVTGAYSCSVSYTTIPLINGRGPYCLLQLTVYGALAMSSPTVSLICNGDCSVYTQAAFKQQVTAATGIATQAINIVSYQCSPIRVTLTIRGSSAALIAAARAALIAAVNARILPCTYGPTIVSDPIVPNYYPVPYCRYYPCVPTIPFNPSSSNPGLLALLTLLVIPVFIFVGLLIYMCLPRAPVCEPVPVCPPAPVCPAPAPVVYYAEPCAMPCPCPAPAPACF